MHKSMEKFYRFIARSTRVIAMSVCGCITIFIFAASYETVFNVDLPVVNAVGSVNIQPLERLMKAYKTVNQTDFGNYGMPQYLKVPIKSAKVTLAPAIITGDTALARANAGHVMLTAPPRNGQLGNMAIYLRSSWRTLVNANDLNVGDNVFIDTDRDWRYFYRINEVKVIRSHDSYIARDSAVSQLLILTSVDGSDDQVVIEAAFVNVQNVKV